jgi:hypothetical protein
MVDVSIDNASAVFTLKGADKFWAFRSEVKVPLVHIADVREEASPPMGWFPGLKLLGTSIPNYFRAGTFYQAGGPVFWDVRHPEKTIVVELRDERLKKLIVEVESPARAVRMIKDAIQRRNRLF